MIRRLLRQKKKKRFDPSLVAQVIEEEQSVHATTQTKNATMVVGRIISKLNAGQFQVRADRNELRIALWLAPYTESSFLRDAGRLNGLEIREDYEGVGSLFRRYLIRVAPKSRYDPYEGEATDA